MKNKLKITCSLILLILINLSVLEAQSKRLVIKGIVNKKVVDSFGVFAEDSIRIGDTVNMEVIYNYLTQKETSNLYYGFEGKYFIKQDSNYFRASIKKYYFNYNIRVKGSEFLINKLDNTTAFGSEQDRLDVFIRAIDLPHTNKNDSVNWGISRMELIAIDTTSNIWSNNTLPMPDNLNLFVNDLGQIHFWGESVHDRLDNKIFYMDIMAKIISIKTFDYFPIITSTEAPNTNQSLSFTPNPSATGLFQFEGNIDVRQLHVYNAQGNAITPIMNHHTLDLSAFPKGMYMVLGTANGRIVSKKVVIE